MKNINMIGLGAIALISSISFAAVMPSLASFQAGEPAIAQTAKQEDPIKLQLAAERQSLLAVASGQMKWQPMVNNTALRPGENIRYVVTASNVSDRTIKKLVVNQPIPNGSIYVMGSATLPNVEGATVDYSIDGGKKYSQYPTIKVKQADGTIVDKPAPESMYTHVRWNFGDNFPAKTATNATYQVRIR
jgi:uncharacterized repeat protein (TIGR01451 family)